MKWCSHCQRSCQDVCMYGFISCPMCGKVLAEVGIRKSSYLIKASQRRMKRVKKKENMKKMSADATEPDCSCTCSSNPSIPESKVQTECSQKATDKNRIIEGCSTKKSNSGMIWCSHCLKPCRTERWGDSICCSFCGKVLCQASDNQEKFLLNYRGNAPDLKKAEAEADGGYEFLLNY